MNKFDELFFSQYVSNGTKLVTIVHKHIIVIIDKIILNYFFGAILPSFLYYYSDTLKGFIPFFVLEIFLIGMFIKWLYDILDWYNDAWIVTEDGVIDLDWKLFNSNSVAVKYAGIEWLEYIEKWFLDALLWKWDIVIHKVWGGNKFILENAATAMKNIEMIDKRLKETKKKIQSHAKPTEEKPPENFETVLKALTAVVEGYLQWNGYKKDDSEEKKALIKEVKKMWWAIDLTAEKKAHHDEHDDWHDHHWHGHH